MGNRLFDRISELFVRVYFVFHVKWVVYSAMIWNYFNVKPAATGDENIKDKRRKIVHIGDDFALGVGDWVTFMGPGGPIHYVNHQQPLLITKWITNIEGRPGALSEDWIPGALFFEECFHPHTGTQRDADIVMITLGSNDRCAASQTASNISTLYAALRQRLHSNAVIIINIPPIPYVILSRPDDSKVKKRVLERNDMIRAAILKHEFDERCLKTTNHNNNNEGDVKPRKDVNELINLSTGPLRFGVDMHRMFDGQEDAFTLRGLFLKPRAYREAGRRLNEAVFLAQKTVEADDLKLLLCRS